MCMFLSNVYIAHGGQMVLKILKLGLGMLVNCYVKNGT